MNTKLMFKYLKKLPGKFFLPIIAAIWVMGVGLRWISIPTCMVLTAVIVAVWLVYALVRWRMAKEEGEEASDSVEIAGFEERLVNAVRSAKDSPWYLVIGPTGCGKTNIIRNSDLDFSYIDSLQEKPPKQGLEPTKNCDLFHAKKAVILDTAGRYITLGKESQVQAEWMGLLSLLKKHRKVRPVEGLVLVADISLLLQSDEDALQKEAKDISDRIAEIIRKLESAPLPAATGQFEASIPDYEAEFGFLQLLLEVSSALHHLSRHPAGEAQFAHRPTQIPSHCLHPLVFHQLWQISRLRHLRWAYSPR